jgi:hypothetical protein
MMIRPKLMAALPAILLIGTGRSADINNDTRALRKARQ